jgi:hypothetical protein
MRQLLLGALAPAALMAASPADARATRVDIPVQVDPSSPVYVLWVKVRADGDRTLVSGYVRQKRWFARRSGDLHIAFLRQGQPVACQESDWKRYRLHSRGQWRFTSSAEVATSAIDSVRISHVVHDRETDRAPGSASACAGPAMPAEQHAGGA